MRNDKKKQAMYERLQSLAKGGRLTPEAVVKDAKQKTSPLHDAFEWDDAKAAAKYRIDQARDLIQSFKVYIELRETVIAAPAFVRDPNAERGEQGYRETTALKDDHALAVEALVGEADRAGAYLQRVRHLAVALGLEGEVDEILARHMAFRERLTTQAT